MLLRQYYLPCLAHASYLVGDETTHSAVVVDPKRDVQQYLDDAAALGVSIDHVVLTHLHADFIAGHLELRDRVGATIYLGASARAEYGFTPLKSGDAIALGTVTLVARETPGHTPESISLLVYDLSVSAETPHAVLTGDTLFVGDVGRPDLRASLGWAATDLGRMLYHSLHEQLLPLPDTTLVYPAHGAGSLCGKNISKETVSTMGDQRRTNYALQPMTEDAFIKLVTADQPDAPGYFTYDAVMNAKERPDLDTVIHDTLKPLSLATALDMMNGGAQVLDVREPSEFAQGHLRGSLNIGLGGQYATWAGTLLDRERPIVIIAAPGREGEALTRLGRIGFDNVAGYLDGGMQSLDEHADLLDHSSQVSPATLAQKLEGSVRPAILDIRTANEWQAAHIDGSLNVPLNRLNDRLSEVPRDRDLVVHCAGGYRSSIAIGLLQQHGFTRVAELTGGLAAWQLHSR